MGTLVQLQQILRQSRTLQDAVREDIRTNRFPADDLRMDNYNDLAMMFTVLLPDDPIASRLGLMPDATLKGMGLQAAPDVASRRLDARLTQLINRLEQFLGDDGTIAAPTRSAKKLLEEERETKAFKKLYSA